MVDRLPPKDSPFPTAPPEAWPAIVPPRPPEPAAERTTASTWGAGAWLVLALAVVFSIIVTYGLGWALARDNQRLLDASRTNQETETTPSSTEPATSTTAVAPTLLELFPTLVDFVATTRAQQFRDVPTLVPLSDRDFSATVGGWLGRRATALDLVAKRYTALGVLPRPDWATPLTSLLVTHAPVAYDVRSNQLAVRNRSVAKPTPFVRVEIVRQLARVLDAQAHGAAGPPGPFVDSVSEEAGFGEAVVAAGSADFVVQAYRSRLSAEEKDAAARDAAAQVAAATAVARGSVLLTLELEPGKIGAPLIAAYLQSKGLPGLDALLVSPPHTSAQAIRGELGTLDPPDPIAMAEPLPGGTMTARGAFGANDLALTIGKADTSGSVVPTAWAGGRYVLWEPSAGKACIRFRVAGDTSENTQLLLGLVDQWAVTSRASVRTATDPGVPGKDRQVVEATRCS